MSTPFILAGKKVYVAGHGGMVGAALCRRLVQEACQVVTAPRSLDLREQGATREWFEQNRPDAVFLAAAKVGGIGANAEFPGQFIHDNLMIQTNVIEASRRSQVGKLLFLGSSCIYPKFADQPIGEDALLTGALEPTNEWYAIAKIAGIKLCQAYRREYGCDFISAMPTNLYGPGDNFDLSTSHVLPALMRKAHEAKSQRAASFEIWGTGAPLREFLHVDDMADACVFLMKNYSGETHVNVGAGQDISIADLARLICETIRYGGDITLDPSKPDGTPRKLMDSGRINAMGWAPSIPLAQGIAATYDWFCQQYPRTGA